MKDIYPPWSEAEISILQDNIDKGYDHIATLVPSRSRNSIRHRCNILGLKAGFGHRSHLRKYKVNDVFFSNQNPRSCYWAGFIAADGYISPDYRVLSINISSLDIEHLEQFKIDLDFDGPIRYNRDAVLVEIRSQQLCNDLKNNFNITNKKTFTLQAPSIEDSTNRLSFIAGLIDGDGTIYNHSGRNHMTLVGTKSIVSWTKKTLDTEVFNKKWGGVYDRGSVFQYCIAQKATEQLITTVTKLDIPYLKRKWVK